MPFLDFEVNKEHNVVPFSRILKAWSEDDLAVKRVKTFSSTLAKDGYDLSPDDLNKLRQFLAKVKKTFPKSTAAIPVIRRYSELVTQFSQEYEGQEIDSSFAEKLNSLVKPNPQISKTCLEKLRKLLDLKKIKMDV